MRYEIKHSVRYAYDGPVGLEPLTLRLRPRCGPGQELESFELKILPEPAGFSESWDPYGNAQALAWFAGTDFKGLTIQTRSVVQSLNRNPFHYLITDPGMFKVPVAYPEGEAASLAPYLRRENPDPEVTAWADRLQAESRCDTLRTLAHGAQQVNEHIQSILRLEGAAWKPGDTFRKGEGACRDLTVLYIDMCRAWGLAARFVSGYRYDPEAIDRHEMHAWAEVYLTGAGWRGYDPTTGLATGDRHIPVVAAPDPAGAEALRGTFRGDGVKARMEYRVDLTNLGRSTDE